MFRCAVSCTPVFGVLFFHSKRGLSEQCTRTHCPVMDAEKETKQLPSLTERYSSNPFFEGFAVRGKIKKRVISSPSPDRFLGIAEGDTPEDTSLAAVQRFKVDEERFVKVYTRFFASWFDMSKTAQRTFQAVMEAIQARPNDDCFWLSLDDAQAKTGLKSRNTITNGLRELVALKIIAPSSRGTGWWYYNPQYIFNGDRMSFYTEIVKVKKAKEDPNQLSFDMDSGRIISPEIH